jgi:F0F1-type ATP synthase beta subunit
MNVGTGVCILGKPGSGEETDEKGNLEMGYKRQRQTMKRLGSGERSRNGEDIYHEVLVSPLFAVPFNILEWAHSRQKAQK